MTHHHRTIDLDDITHSLTNNLTVLVRHAALALEGAEQAESHPTSATLPGTWFGFTTAPLDAAGTVKLRTSAEQWILLNTLRTLVMLIEISLSKAWHYAHLFELNRQGGVTAPLLKQHEADVKVFREMFFFKKLSKLKKDFGDSILPPLTHPIISFRNVRNVLEHQYGVVSHTDLEVEWQAFSLFHVALDGKETPLVPEPGKWGALRGGGVMVGDGTVARRLTTHKKIFPVGTHVALTRQELAEMCFTTHLWGSELTRTVHTYATTPVPEASPPPPPPPPSEAQGA